MQVSEKGIEAIISFEGMELEAYMCPAGVWTIGVGHTGFVDGAAIVGGMSVSHKKAMELLREDLKGIEEYLNKQPFSAKLTQGQFDAIASLIFNIGKGAFGTSTMRRKLCMGANADEVAAEFVRWVYGTVGGKKQRLSGLVKRRNIEAKMYIDEE